jgi:protein-L-isoaspartate(D-aspartate) O-methyltransferase
MQDSFVFQGKRRQLIEKLRADQVAPAHVLDAMERLPRHWFVDSDFANWAYEDKPVHIGCDQTISQPRTVARQTALLDPQKEEHILEIGTGSGYQAMILSALGAKVVTIERQEELFNKARDLFRSLQPHKVKAFLSDGMLGWPRLAPFDGILVTAGCEIIPKPLLEQLKIGGRMIIPVGPSPDQLTMMRIVRISEQEFKQEAHGAFKFVPLLSGINPKQS